jgi:hypothetical protein
METEMAGAAAGGFVILTLQFRKEGHFWLGECKELGTATDGRSLERVRLELEHLVTLHLLGLEDAGERDRFFAENGIKLYTDGLPSVVERSVPVSDDGGSLMEARSISVPMHRHDLVGA